MIRPSQWYGQSCFALEKENIVGEAMNFGFYNITETF